MDETKRDILLLCFSSTIHMNQEALKSGFRVDCRIPLFFPLKPKPKEIFLHISRAPFIWIKLSPKEKTSNSYDLLYYSFESKMASYCQSISRPRTDEEHFPGPVCSITYNPSWWINILPCEPIQGLQIEQITLRVNSDHMHGQKSPFSNFYWFITTKR